MWSSLRRLCILIVSLSCLCALANAQPADYSAQLKVLFSLYEDGRFDEAEKTAVRLVGVAEQAFGPDHIRISFVLNAYGNVLQRLGRYADAERVHLRSLAIREMKLPAGDTEIAISLSNLANVYGDQGRYRDAERSYARALSILEKAKGPNDPEVASTLNNLGVNYRKQGRFLEAEKVYSRALAIREKVLGPNHREVGVTLNNMGNGFQEQGRYSDAERFYARALAIREKALGSQHPEVAQTLSNIGLLYEVQQRFAEAERVYTRALTIREQKLGANHPETAETLQALGALLRLQQRYADAEGIVSRALTVVGTQIGEDGDRYAALLQELGLIKQAQNKYQDAERLFARALTIMQKALGPDHPDVGGLLEDIGKFEETRGRWLEAYTAYARASSITAKYLSVVQKADKVRHAGQSDVREVFGKFVQAAWQLGNLRAPRLGALMQEAFVAAQQATETSTALALSQMTARFATGDSELAEFVRQSQDIASARTSNDEKLVEELGELIGKRNEALIARLRLETNALEKRLERIKEALKSKYPAYSQLAYPTPLEVADAQKQLRPDEALLVFSVEAENTYVWAVTNHDAAWKRIDLKRGDLTTAVAKLRKTLDLDAIQDAQKANRPPPLFQPLDAFELYKKLLAPLDALISGKKHLLVVANGPLSSLPFQVLVTEAALGTTKSTDDLATYRNIAWLMRRHAISVLPSVGSLKSLRANTQGRASRMMIGFGNPLLVGPAGNDRSAFQFNSCEEVKPSSAHVASRKTIESKTTQLFRDVGVNLEELRRQYPLPDTADELCAVSRALGSQQSQVYLGSKATEGTVKVLSKNGELAKYQIVHFATHGIMAGQLTGLAEPALVLTPPVTATVEDDGLLTASEVAQLRLNADWVVLSACNTAAAIDAVSGESLSGLARAFFYAGARSLLVSHWAIASNAAVVLTTKTVESIMSEPSIGRAEALRRAALYLMMDETSPWNAYPAMWAPFALVGDGAPRN